MSVCLYILVFSVCLSVCLSVWSPRGRGCGYICERPVGFRLGGLPAFDAEEALDLAEISLGRHEVLICRALHSVESAVHPSIRLSAVCLLSVRLLSSQKVFTMVLNTFQTDRPAGGPAGRWTDR